MVLVRRHFRKTKKKLSSGKSVTFPSELKQICSDKLSSKFRILFSLFGRKKKKKKEKVFKLVSFDVLYLYILVGMKDQSELKPKKCMNDIFVFLFFFFFKNNDSIRHDSKGSFPFEVSEWKKFCTWKQFDFL